MTARAATGREDNRMRAKSWIKLAVIVVLISLALPLAFNGFRLSAFASDTGSDVILVYVAKDTTVENFDDRMENTVKVLGNRLENAGYVGAIVARQSDDSIRVEISNVDDPQEVMDIIGKSGHLEFRDPNGNVILEGSNIEECYVTEDCSTFMYEVAFKLDAEGTEAFADATTTYIGQTISIYLDDEEISSPTVNDVITGGTGIINFGFSVTQAESFEKSKDLTMLIQSGELPLDIEESETQVIGH